MMRSGMLGERAVQCWQDQEREAEALRVANEWMVHAAMYRRDTRKRRMTTVILLTIGLASLAGFLCLLWAHS